MRIIPDGKAERGHSHVDEFFLPDREYDLFVDGSFLDKNRNKAGVGVIVTPSKDIADYVVKDDISLILGYNISSLKIRASKYTELWAATLALEDLKDFKINRLVFDSPVTEDRITSFRDQVYNYERILPEFLESVELYDRLMGVVDLHPDVELQHLKRERAHMPDADKASRVSATRRIARIFSMANERDAPCIYKILNQDGDVRSISFYDRMSNYDVFDYHKAFKEMDLAALEQS